MFTPDQSNKPNYMAPPQPPTGNNRMPNGPSNFPPPQPLLNNTNLPPQRPFYNGATRPPSVNGAMPRGPYHPPQIPRMVVTSSSNISSSATGIPLSNNFINSGMPPPRSFAPNSIGQQPPRGPFPPLPASSNVSGPPPHSANQSASQKPQFPPTQTTTTFYQGTHQPGQPMVPPTPNMAVNNSNAGPGMGGVLPPPTTSSTANFGGPPSSHQNVTSDRPNELPVPFHGQGQYSHQVNPFMQNSPVPTPGNSEPASRKSSRGASPVSESAIDALEGQFTPGHGTPSPRISSANNSPVPGTQVNNAPLPPNTFIPLQQRGGTNTPPTGTNTPPMGDQARQSPRPQLQPGMPQQPLPARPGFQPQPPRPGFQPQPTGPMMSPRAPGYGPPPSSMPPSSIPNPTSMGHMPRPPNLSQPQRPPVSGSYPPLPPSMSGIGTGPSGNAMMPPYSQPQPPMTGLRPAGVPPPPSSQPGGMHPPPQTFHGEMPPLPQQPQPPMGTYQPTSMSSSMPPMPGIGSSYPNMAGMTNSFGQMSIPDNQRTINLMNEKNLISPDGIETSAPVFPHDFKKNNCSPDVFRCTLNAIPCTSSLLNKARLPLGIIIHPFRDLSQLPVIQSSVIVRCRSCRTYINPFVTFVDTKRWKCNLCFRVNELPDEFSFDPVSKSYGDPQRRPEIKSATIEFIAPSEYMLRPPQPAVYLFLLDVSFNAVETGYLSQFCQVLLEELSKLPGDGRTAVGFVCYDKILYYFNLSEGLSQPQMLCVPDLEDPLLPCPDNLLVNLHESKDLVIDLLNQLPNLFKGNLETGSALGPALQAAHKLMGPTGGRVTVMQTCLPTVGVGALENRESAASGKNVANIGPATDFYKKLSLDFSAQQVAVDLFLMSGQYADMATLSCISKYSAGCVYFFPSLHSVRNVELMDKFETDLRRYLTRKIGFEAVMRIRCSRGLSIHTFHGNFFVRSTDLLSLPNINPDAGFGMQMSIEDNLNDASSISFQAALLYTSSKGERRIRVHTLCVPVTSQLNEVFVRADQQAITCLLSKMAVDRSINSSISDARDAMINAVMDALSAYAQSVRGSDKGGQLIAPHSLRLLPMFILALMKSTAFGLSSSTKLDQRVFAMQEFKVQPLCYLIQTLYPHLYPLHRLNTEKPIKRGKEEIPSAPYLQLSSANIDRTGLFLMDAGHAMYMLVGSGVGDQMCQDLFDKPNFMSIPDNMTDLPELENPTSEGIRSFVNYLMDSRPHGVTFMVIRDDSKYRFLFFHHMLEDRTESSMSYYEYLQFLQGKAK